MSTQHELCPDCGLMPKGAFKHLWKWFVRCPALGCHNTTAPADSPEDAWKIWDGWARRARLKEALAKRDRDRAAEAGARTLCRLCGRLIVWGEDADGERTAFDVQADGTPGPNHATTCKPYLERLATREAAEVPA